MRTTSSQSVPPRCRNPVAYASYRSHTACRVSSGSACLRPTRDRSAYSSNRVRPRPLMTCLTSSSQYRRVKRAERSGLEARIAFHASSNASRASRPGTRYAIPRSSCRRFEKAWTPMKSTRPTMSGARRARSDLRTAGRVAMYVVNSTRLPVARAR